MCDHHTSNRRGSSLEDGQAHEKDHQLWSRRAFLSRMGIAGGAAMMFGGLSINALGSTPMVDALVNANSDRVLVLLQMKGGNDGLNTVIPLYDFSYYTQVRPTLAFKERDVIKMNSTYGFSPDLNDILPLWDRGKMKVIQSVGYPDQNLSHFRSTDIWSAASESDGDTSSGWLGRWLDVRHPDFINNPPSDPPAIQIGSNAHLVFEGSQINMSVAVADPNELYEIAQTGQLYDPQAVPNNCYGEQLTFLRTIANNTFNYAESIQQSYNASRNQAEYETESDLGNQLALVARMIKGGLNTKLYMVSIDGFDTHANQADTHPQLMRDISHALTAFYEDLEGSGDDQRVLTMTFSEFGRRIEENGSRGTDHGSAAPMFLFGPSLNGNGFIGQAAKLQEPDDYGNLQFYTDFRDIYANVLENWLCIDSQTVNEVIGRNHTTIEGLGITCVEGGNGYTAPSIGHRVRSSYTIGQLEFHYTLREDSHVRITFFDMQGRKVMVLTDGSEQAGPQKHTFNYRQTSIKPGYYAYTIEALDTTYSGKFMIGR